VSLHQVCISFAFSYKHSDLGKRGQQPEFGNPKKLPLHALGVRNKAIQAACSRP